LAAFLGVLMLETRFPRPIGDIGNPGSFDFPVRYAIVRGATASRVVQGRAEGLLQPLNDAARRLIDDGAAAITTSCGFLVLFQSDLAAALPVPVWTSSLLKLSELRAPGVITVDAGALGPQHLRAIGADTAVPVVGLAPGCHLQRALLHDQPTFDPAVAEADTVAAARELTTRYPQVQEIVFECTNLPPYADAVIRATGRPVHHIVSLLHERWRALKAQA